MPRLILAITVLRFPTAPMRVLHMLTRYEARYCNSRTMRTQIGYATALQEQGLNKAAYGKAVAAAKEALRLEF